MQSLAIWTHRKTGVQYAVLYDAASTNNDIIAISKPLKSRHDNTGIEDIPLDVEGVEWAEKQSWILD